MDEAEVKAVLGHEFCHFTGSDTLYGSQVAPAYHSIQQGIASMKANMGNSLYLVVVFLIPLIVLWAYQMGFRTIDHALSRRRELRCDEIASQVYGQQAMAAALVKVIGYGASVQHVNAHFAALMQQGQTFSNYPEWFGLNRDYWTDQIEGVVAAATAARTRAFDTHPALRSRLTALGVAPEAAARYTANGSNFSMIHDISSIERLLTNQYSEFMLAALATAEPTMQ